MPAGFEPLRDLPLAFIAAQNLERVALIHQTERLARALSIYWPLRTGLRRCSVSPEIVRDCAFFFC
jgi:hypothetical protein